MRSSIIFITILFIEYIIIRHFYIFKVKKICLVVTAIKNHWIGLQFEYEVQILKHELATLVIKKLWVIVPVVFDCNVRVQLTRKSI